MARASTMAEQLSMEKISDNRFESYYFPMRMGNTANIAYGGCSVAAAVYAALQTLPSAPNSPYHLYSACGYFLGPTFTDRNVFCTVRHIRDTRTFATREVQVSQDLGKEKGERVVYTLYADFQVAERASIFEYSPSPVMKYGGLDEQPTLEEALQDLVKQGLVSQKLVDYRNSQFGLFSRFFDAKPCKEGIIAQNLSGIAKHLSTTQDHLPMPQRTSADWIKTKHPLPTQADQLSALAFVMDGSIAFIPLTHDHKFVDDVAACSSLDSAMRVFTNDVDLSKWHLRELTTIAAGVGRTYSEARLWDMKGNLIVSVTQQSIMRPFPEKKASL